MRQMMNREECAVLASSGKKKSVLDRDINGRRTFGFLLFSLPTRSCCLSALRLLCLALSFFTRRPLLRLTWWWWWWFSFIHLLLRTHHTTFFEDDLQKKKKLCRIVSHRCFSITRSIKDQTWCVGVFESEFRAWLSLIPFSFIFIDRCCQRGEIGLR